MQMTNRLTALTAAVLLVMTALTPMAVAASATGNTADVAVETHEASNVTNASATLNGELTELPENESATLYFEYWAEGDAGNATTTESGVAEEPNTFRTTVDGLENGTTYVYVAHAETNDTAVTGEEVTFTAGASEENETKDENATDAFGQNVSAFVHSVLENKNETNESVGMLVSEFVTENNPGAEKRPDHAGPPEDRGPNAAEDKRQGPPEDAGPSDDKRQGPPEDRGDDDEEDEEDDDDDEENGGGPPEHAGPN